MGGARNRVGGGPLDGVPGGSYVVNKCRRSSVLLVLARFLDIVLMLGNTLS